MDRRGFLKYLGGGVALGAAAFVKIDIPDILPAEAEVVEDVYVDPVLSDISVSYFQDKKYIEDSYHADSYPLTVLTRKMQAKQEGEFCKYTLLTTDTSTHS